MYRTYTGGERPRITTIQNTQANGLNPEFLTLPQVIPTSIPILIPHKSIFLPFHFSSDTEFQLLDDDEPNNRPTNRKHDCTNAKKRANERTQLIAIPD